jgi:2-polyprenyl-3-methyl-5-hydroxy-6-metoxy-1,4-benzoquinol methylase
MIDEAKLRTPEADRNRVIYCVGDAASYDPRRKFDLVLCIGVFAHVESVDDLVEHLARLTERNGLLVIQITDSESLWARVSRLTFGTVGNPIT